MLLAFEFLTILPVRLLRRKPSATAGVASNAPDMPDMGRALPWFPLVGAMLGALLALVDWALTPLLALGVRDAILLALAALLTGLLHLDGFVDCCDGLLGARSVERRLEIMRDSRVGAYGALGGALLLIARFAALGALPFALLVAPGGPLYVRALAFIAAPLIGRWAMVYTVIRFPYARATGVGAPFRAGDGKVAHAGRRLALATLLTAVIMLALAALTILSSSLHLSTSGIALDFTPGVTSIALALLLFMAGMWLIGYVITLGWARWAARRLGGGLTGDTYGALNELVELAVLVCAPPLAMLCLRVA